MNHLIMWIQNSLKAVCKILKLWEERDCENIGYALLVHYCVCECPGRLSQLFFLKPLSEPDFSSTGDGASPRVSQGAGLRGCGFSGDT